MKTDDKETYRSLCKIEPTIPIFSRDWWLDAVCGKDNWDVALVGKGGMIVAAMPYYMQKRFGKGPKGRILIYPIGDSVTRVRHSDA